MNGETVLAYFIIGNEAWIGYALLGLLVLYGLALWLAPSRAKALQDLARKHNFRFEPIMSRKELGIEGTTFDLGLPAENCMRGMAFGQETIVFDKTMPLEPADQGKSDSITCERTIVGFRIAPTLPVQNRTIAKPGEWHVEKMGEWVFLYGRIGLVKPRQMEAYVEQARKWYERATDPQAS